MSRNGWEEVQGGGGGREKTDGLLYATDRQGGSEIDDPSLLILSCLKELRVTIK